jgi:3-hydroxyisobutyrate dehydrogenase-like beta-hydroxyacid dehydrogenase
MEDFGMSVSASESPGTVRRVAVLGAGRMGSALVRMFLKRGYETIVWNRTLAKLAPLEALGARRAVSLVDAATAADIVIVNVNNYDAANGMLRNGAAENALRDKLLVQLTSGSPGQARDTKAWADEHGIHYLDGAIMATPDLVGTPDSTILYSGDPALFERYKSALLVLGGNSRHVGDDPGHASALDSAILVVMWGSLFGALQGTAICRACGLNLRDYASYLAPFLDPLSGWTLDVVQRIGEHREAGDSDTVATVGTHYGAFQCLMELCRESGVDVSLPAAMEPVFRAAIWAGHSEDDFAVLHRFFDRHARARDARSSE